MSQGESAPRPVSRHSLRSPSTAAASSPPSRRSRVPQDDPRARPLHGPGGITVTGGDERDQYPGTRAVDSRDISNPAGPHGALIAPAATPTQPSVAGGNPQSAMGTGQYGSEGSPSRPFALPAQGSATPQPTNPTAPPTPSPVAASTAVDRGSPPIVHPYPLAARRILTPKSPRATSLSRAALRTVEAQHLANFPAAGPRSGTTSHDVQALGGTPPFHGSIPGQGTAVPPPTRPPSGLARSLSQPSLSHGLPSNPHGEPFQPGRLKREHSGRPVFSGPPFAAPLPANRGYGPSGLLGDGRWGAGLISSLPPGGSAARNLQIAEGQTLLTITPRHGEEIVVPVDVHQASKQADEKRQRNAGASARFRQRKKEREREQQEGMQKLENQNRELEKKNEELRKQCQDLENQRNFYRSERNRLREIVSRTPGISEWADRGPPSPIPSRGGAFAPDSNTLLAHPPPPPPPPPPPAPSHTHTHTHSHSHSQIQSRPAPYPHALAHPHPRSSSYGDPSMLEPPARRRRTDSEPQLPTTSYSLMTPASLPPIPGPPPTAFGIPPSPHITPPPGTARLPPLPPLRFDQPRPPSTTPPPIQSAPPPPSVPPQSASPYPSYRKHPYETGWATEPRGQAEGGPR
ncbi:BZIP domain-containing protein [Madurella fahalii]|uniref:BZIP domain-containing protein n=1 Tax=Madurella fahalii TaxID=1157608 RepID=A0ABQ0GS08_9PEZI